MRCGVCGKEVFDNGEERFACPYCGAEVIVREETLVEENMRLERELERQKLKTQIEELSATAATTRSLGDLFSFLDRQSARAAIERGDFDAARRYLAKAEQSFNIGCLINIVIFVAIFVCVLLWKL